MDTSQVPLPLLGGHLQCSAVKDSGHMGLSSDRLGTLDHSGVGVAAPGHCICQPCLSPLLSSALRCEQTASFCLRDTNISTESLNAAGSRGVPWTHCPGQG